MSYEKQSWVDGQTLSAARLNHIENGIETAAQSTIPQSATPPPSPTIGDLWLDTSTET